MALLIEPIQAELHLSDTSISLLIGFAFAMIYAVMGMPLAFVADRWNRVRLISIGIAFWSLMTAAGALAKSFGALFTSRMGIGIGEAALSPAVYSILGDLFPKEKLGRAMSAYAVAVPFGSGLALLFGGLIVSAISHVPYIAIPIVGELASWRLVLLCVGLPGLLVALLIRLTIAEPARRGAKGPPATFRWRDAAEVFAYLRQHWAAFGSVILGVTLFSGYIFGVIAWVPTMFNRTHGIAPEAGAMPFGAMYAVFGSAGILVGGAWGDSLFRRGEAAAHPIVMATGFAIAAVSFTLAPLMPNPNLAFAMYAPGLFGGMLQTGLMPALFRLMTPSHLRAQTFAFYLLICSVGGVALAPTEIALFTDYVFKDQAALRYSLSVVGALSMFPAALVIFLGLDAVRRTVAEQAAREVALSG